jgi:hypothetical protein
MMQPLNIGAGPFAAFGMIVAVAGAALLAVSGTTPGCTGPAASQPCDYAGSFRAAAAQFRGHSPHFAIQVLDVGSSAYVLQAAPSGSGVILHTPGALIGKKSCRVCRADGYAAYAAEDGWRVLANYPAEKPRSGKAGAFGY